MSFSFLADGVDAVLAITFKFSIPDLISSAMCAGTSSMITLFPVDTISIVE